MSKQSTAQKNAEQARKLKERIALQLKKGAGKGVEAAVRFLESRIKETVSVPAPKKLGANKVYRALTKATKGAPPRVLSGRLRQGVTHRMLSPIRGAVGVHARGLPSKKHPSGFNYPKHHEVDETEKLGTGEHPYLKPTVEKYKRELKVLVGAEVKTELKAGGW